MALLDPAQLAQRVSAVLVELRTSPLWIASLDQATIGNNFLVKMIIPQQVHADYFIVELRTAIGITARFAIDGDNGALLRAQGARQPRKFLRAYADINKAIAPHLSPTPGGPPPTPEIVWRPCRESTTRFLPFWRFQFAAHTLYVRADGVVFDALTTGRG